ncbi:MAG: hypothetical protein PVI30_05930 [Myxococcales bacterium]|jgi:hypothetical protein
MKAISGVWLVPLLALAAAGGFYGESCVSDGDPPPAQAFRVALGTALSGAVFTTLEDGARVNANIYEAKEDVYLDGGPGPGAPVDAAGLPAGDYYFQVTDPSGKTLLSSDHISCRRIRINGDGVIDHVYPGTDYVKVRGKLTPEPCRHQTGTDQDHDVEGAITVQLMPYDDTPNRGGVYKVWLTPTPDYAGDPNAEPTAKKGGPGASGDLPGFHGFLPARSKTDNYKVERKGKPVEPMTLAVRKFHDANLDGAQNAGEDEIEGWEVLLVDPLGAGNYHYTPVSTIADEGTWLSIETLPPGATQTAAYLDGSPQSAWPTADPIVSVIFDGASGETHEVLYGNVGLGFAQVCKVFDRDGDGEADADEPTVEGFRFELSGTAVTGDAVGPLIRETSESGCATFADLLPGEYTITERLPPHSSWVATGETQASITIESTVTGSTVTGNGVELKFRNRCTLEADFGTKGYWHNKNGLDELTDADLVHVNGLDPYDAPSSYFDAGDEPFDGQTAGGDVPAAHGDSGEQVAPAGSALAEVSYFLVDANAGGDPREQLAQQLLAFIFNVRHRLDGAGATIQLPDASFVNAASVIDDALAAWTSDSADAQTEIATLLDALNNQDALPYVPQAPCPVTYPE